MVQRYEIDESLSNQQYPVCENRWSHRDSIMDLSEILSKLDCPVNWNLESVLADLKIKRTGIATDSFVAEKKRFIKSVDEKLRCDIKYAQIDGSAALQKCSQYLTLAWLHYGLTETPERSLQNMRRHLQDAHVFVEAASSGIELITRYTKALKYLFNAMWAHLHHVEKNFEKAQEFVDLLTQFDGTDDRDQAAVFALKSCVFMEFGPAGHTRALEAIRKALELENAAEWHFLKGKCMSRRRRAQNFQSVPSDEELFHLRKAVEINQGAAFHYVFCGQSVKEYAMYSPAAKIDHAVESAHFDECENCFEVAYSLNDDSPIILTRIAKGLMHIKSVRGADILERCILRSLELFPESGLTNHVAGNFYMYEKHDTKLAIYHLKKAALDHGITGAFINLIDMVWKKTENNIGPLVEKFWDYYHEDPFHRIKAAGLMAYFYFFVENNISKSISFWREVMRHGNENDGRIYKFVGRSDLTVLLVGEIQNRLRIFRSDLSSDEEDAMGSFLSEVFEARPKLNIALNLRTREDSITDALASMSSDVKNVLARKLSVKPPIAAYRIPARRVECQERTLPSNWRRP